MGITKIVLEDKFLSNYQKLVKEEMIPYQWNVLNDSIDITIEKERNDDSIPSEKSHAIENFKITAGRSKGEHYGWVFQDSDVYKWLEAVAYTLEHHPDKKLQENADEVVELIAEAQQDDGYLNTYFTIKEPERRFKCLIGSHELYCAGHFIEAAVAYHQVTGNERVMEIATRLADCIDRNFGKEDGKIHGVDGHEEIELALMKLYRATGNDRYLNLAEYFLLERGQNPDFFKEQAESDSNPVTLMGMGSLPLSYFQMHAPLLQQDSAEGHAVRLLYLYIGLADLAASTGNKQFYDVCKKIWRNIVDRRMFITGGVGSTVIGESFTLDYDLPNDTMYCETCASVSMIFFADRMLKNQWLGEYGDIAERALYNSVLSGMALDGKHFFYVNPLEVVPKKSKKDPTKSHVKPVRPQWLGCACCPPNLARLVASVQKYIYYTDENKVLVNLFATSQMDVEYNGNKMSINQITDYPIDGNVKFEISDVTGEGIELYVRIPSWVDSYEVIVDGDRVSPVVDNGIAFLGHINADMVIELRLKMEPQRWYANANVSENIGKVAIGYGPFVYCIESVDDGEDLHLISLDSDAAIESRVEQDEELGDIVALYAKGYRIEKTSDNSLYTRISHNNKKQIIARLIPYYAWGNRGKNEMRVWIRNGI